MKKLARLVPRTKADRIGVFTTLLLFVLALLNAINTLMEQQQQQQQQGEPIEQTYMLTIGVVMLFVATNMLVNMYKTIVTDTSIYSVQTPPSVLQAGWRFCSACEQNAPPRIHTIHPCYPFLSNANSISTTTTNRIASLLHLQHVHPEAAQSLLLPGQVCRPQELPLLHVLRDVHVAGRAPQHSHQSTLLRARVRLVQLEDAVHSVHAVARLRHRPRHARRVRAHAHQHGVPHSLLSSLLLLDHQHAHDTQRADVERTSASHPRLQTGLACQSRRSIRSQLDGRHAKRVRSFALAKRRHVVPPSG